MRLSTDTGATVIRGATPSPIDAEKMLQAKIEALASSHRTTGTVPHRPTGDAADASRPWSGPSLR